MSYRNRALLDLARLLPCTLRLDGCTGRDCVPAHSNSLTDGKGKGVKADDCYFAAACPTCHHLIDDEKRLTRRERRETWMRGFLETVRLLWERGLVVVAGAAPPRTPLPPRMQVRQKYSTATARPDKVLPRRVA